VKKAMLLPLIAVLAALLCVPATAAANGVKTRSVAEIGELEVQVHARPDGYQLDSLHAQLRSCDYRRPSSRDCGWELIGVQGHLGFCATVAHPGEIGGSFRIFARSTFVSKSLSDTHPSFLPLPHGGSAGQPICWYAKAHGWDGVPLIAETHFGG
jgi:hypothetical protein